MVIAEEAAALRASINGIFPPPVDVYGCSGGGVRPRVKVPVLIDREGVVLRYMRELCGFPEGASVYPIDRIVAEAAPNRH